MCSCAAGGPALWHGHLQKPEAWGSLGGPVPLLKGKGEQGPSPPEEETNRAQKACQGSNHVSGQTRWGNPAGERGGAQKAPSPRIKCCQEVSK